MASKVARAAMAGSHTAGIFADMTVDGPVMGDLVVNVDRAKNLPNRKTMGKQNPYCAARLGKEAQKTPTDKRGGQTPKWDHELRFTVHDSLDYRQLKVSVFNDDKKTELIGETWISIEDILKRGGGAKDGWHQLKFKGRYAGEIWIEISYWDTRPREEAQPSAPSDNAQGSSQQERSSEAVGGPRQLQQRAVKRRPLPADPTSGDSTPTRTPLPDTPQPSPHPLPPQRGSGRLHGPSPHTANEAGRHHSQPVMPVSYEPEQQQQQQQQQSAQFYEPPRHQSQPVIPTAPIHPPSEPIPRMVNQQQLPHHYEPARHHSQPIAPMAAAPQPHEPAPKTMNQQQAMQHYDSPRHYSHPVASAPQSAESMPMSVNHPISSHHDAAHERMPDELHFEPANNVHTNPPSRRQSFYDNQRDADHRDYSNGYTEEPELMQSQDYYGRQQHGGIDLPELPPHTPRYQRQNSYTEPKHYSPNEVDISSSYTLPNYGPPVEAPSFRGYESSAMVHDDRSNDAYNARRSFDEYARNVVHPSIEEDNGPPPLPPAHRSSGMGITSSPHGMPPMNPSIPNGMAGSPLARNYAASHHEDDYRDMEPISSQVSADSAPLVRYNPYNSSQQRRASHVSDIQPSYEAYGNMGRHSEGPMEPEEEIEMPYHRRRPSHTPSIYDEVEHNGGSHHGRPSGGMPAELPAEYSTPPYRGRAAPEHRYSAPPNPEDHWETRSQHPSAPLIKPRAVSPNPNVSAPVTPQNPVPRSVARKSVSPHPYSTPSSAPPTSLSSVPFSPDSYEQLNPNLKNAQSINTAGAKYSTPEGAREAARERAKEDRLAEGPIRDHMGKIIDPSDHLPTDTWAPEPEKKAPRKTHQVNIRFKHAPGLGAGAGPRQPRSSPATSAENHRPYSHGSSPVPAREREPLRQIEAPRERLQHSYTENDATPPSGGRNRLQKRPPRGYEQHSEPASYHSSPALPTSHRQSRQYDSPGHGHYNTPSPQQASYPLREHPNYGQGYSSSPAYHHQQHHGSPLDGKGGAGLPPPVPAKVPLERGQEEWSVARMSNEIRGIDIGMGSGGRRGGGRTNMGWRDV